MLGNGGTREHAPVNGSARRPAHDGTYHDRTKEQAETQDEVRTDKIVENSGEWRHVIKEREG